MLLKTIAVGPIQANCSVLADEPSGRAIVVDCGGDVDRVARLLEQHHLSVVAILLTHGHIDHINGVPELKELTGAPVYLHRADEPMYLALAKQGVFFGLSAAEPPPLDGYVEHQQTLRFEGVGDVHVIHTPGHTPGGVCYRVARSPDIVFTGDTVFEGSIGRTDLWGGSYETLIASIREGLLTLPDDTILVTGHGPRTTVGRERRHNPFLG